MKKKTYVHPEMKVAKLEQTEIICTSGEASFSLENNGVLDQGNDDVWGDTNLPW